MIYSKGENYSLFGGVALGRVDLPEAIQKSL